MLRRYVRKLAYVGLMLTALALSVAGCGASGAENALHETVGTVEDSAKIDADVPAGTDNAVLGTEVSDAGETQTGEETGTEKDAQAEDLTLGGMFELYTPEEFAKVVEQMKQYGSAQEEDIRHMEEDLERLRADNGKGEFVIYKGAFEISYETEEGAMISEALDPSVIMIPERMERDKPFTAEEYEEVIEEIGKSLDEMVVEGRVTEEEKGKIVAKMKENLAKFE